jgi:hypothetical protein
LKRNAIANAIKQTQVSVGVGLNRRKTSFNTNNGDMNKNLKGFGGSEKKI